MGKSEIEYKSGFTIKSVILSVLTIIVGLPIAMWLQNLSTKPTTYTGFWLTPLQLVILFELLRRINRKLHLTPQEMTMLTIAGYLLMGITYWISGVPNEGIQEMPLDTLFFPVACLVMKPYNMFYQYLIPSFMVPSDKAALEVAFNGLMPGESINWGAWMGPFLYFTIWGILWLIMSISWQYIVAKQFIIDERLPFPAAVPTSQTILLGVSEKPDEKPPLFDLKNLSSKTFWTFFILGVIFSLQPILAEVVPLIPVAGWWGEQKIKFEGFVKPFLPVTKYWNPKLMLQIAAVLVLTPFDTLITIILTWFVLGVIYPNLLVWFAGVPTKLARNAHVLPPFPYKFWNGWGVDVGISLWFIYLLLPRFKQVFSALKKDIKEQDFSLRIIAIITLASTILYIAFLIGSGVPPLVAIWAFILWFIFFVGTIRFFGQMTSWTYQEPWGNFFAIHTIWGLGVATGAWSAKLPNLSPNYVQSTWLVYTSMEWFGAQSPWFMVHAYKVGYDTKTKLSDIWKMLLLLTIIAVVWGNIFSIWWVNHVGGLKNQGWFVKETSDLVETALGMNIVVTPMPDWALQNPGYLATLSVSGILFAIVIYLIRMRIPAFFIDPIGVTAAIGWFEGIWLNALLALIVKYLILKIGGPKIYEERAMPAIAGFCMGYGFLYIFVALNEFFTIAVPNFAAHYVP